MGNLNYRTKEYRLADIIWANEPIRSGELARICMIELNWKRTTTHTVLTRLCDNVAYLVSGEDSYTSESFGKTLVSFIGKRHITVEQLAEQTHLSPKTIQRMRTKADFRFDHKTVIALCVGLHLDVYDSRKMLELAGLVLTGSIRDRIYQVILNFAFKETLDSCNELLQRLEMEPLTENKAE